MNTRSSDLEMECCPLRTLVAVILLKSDIVTIPPLHLMQPNRSFPMGGRQASVRVGEVADA